MLVIAPGYLLVRGFSVGRTQIPPARDLHVLGEAVVASIAWLVAVYLVSEGKLADYGVLPRDDERLEEHGVEVARLLMVAVVLAPYVVGRLAGAWTRWLSAGTGWVLAWAAAELSGRKGRTMKLMRWGVGRLQKLALLTPPTAWDRFWKRIDPEAGEPVTVHLKEGGIVRGAMASVDLSPLPHQVELADGQAYDANGNALALGTGHRGVYLEGSEIRAVYFE